MLATRPTARLSPGPLLAALMLLAAAAAPALAQKHPEPSPYPISWELRFEYNIPKRIVVDVPGAAHPVAYWYLKYEVSNPGTEPVDFIPQFEMLTDDGRVLRSDRAIPAPVFDAIKTRERNKLLEPASKIEGRLPPGDDQAKEGVAIWKEPAARMKTFSIFVGGLSGESVTLKRGADGKLQTIDPKKSGEQRKGVAEKDIVIVRKAMHLTFHIPGDEVRPGDDPVEPKSETWVMR